ncbi:UNKNOWN [Stylonychia lemnae]|uniref:Uncharacterized protein n=1 Tax=Stylonychia lemnae TaxID=5949 RepID=A0A077ZT47_STYLE|nr:UNKNOWN [Stylonychia lemnae]|eukprot:CDW73058.1 UNKNOWN [Stylonychia lemnae]
MSKKILIDHHPTNTIEQQIQAQMSAMMKKSVDALFISKEMIDMLLNSFEHELFMQECLKKVLPFTCYHACETAMRLSNPILIPYDPRLDDCILQHEDIEEPEGLGLDPLMPGYVQLRKPLDRAFAQEFNTIDATGLKSIGSPRRSVIMGKKTSQFISSSNSCKYSISLDKKSLKKFSIPKNIIEQDVVPRQQLLDLQRSIETEEVVRARFILDKQLARRKVEQDEKQREIDLKLKYEKNKNSLTVRASNDGNITFDFDGNPIQVKQINPNKLKVLEQDQELMTFKMIEQQQQPVQKKQIKLPKTQNNLEIKKEKSTIELPDDIMQEQRIKISTLAPVYHQEPFKVIKPQYGVSLIQEQSPSVMSNNSKRDNNFSVGNYQDNPSIKGKQMTRQDYNSVKSQGYQLTNLNKSQLIDTLDYSMDEELKHLKLDVSYARLANVNDTFFTDTARKQTSKNLTINSEERVSTKFRINKNTVDQVGHQIKTQNQQSRMLLIDDNTANNTLHNTSLNVQFNTNLIGEFRNQQSNKSLHYVSGLQLPKIRTKRAGGRDTSMSLPQSLNQSLVLKESKKRPDYLSKIRTTQNQSVLYDNVIVQKIDDVTGDKLNNSFIQGSSNQQGLINQRNDSFIINSNEKLPKLRYPIPKVKDNFVQDMQQIFNQKDRFNQAIINSKKRQRLLPQKQQEQQTYDQIYKFV